MVSGFAAALRILADAALYRLRKREGANLLTSMTLAAALSLETADIAYRCAFGVALNLFVYLLNDCFDVRVDLTAPGRDEARTRHLAQHLRAGWTLVLALALLLALLGWAHSTGLLVAFGANALLITVYSRWLKRYPVLDLLAMVLWGAGMALVGFPLASADGWRFAGLLAILCAVTEAVQVIRDAESDRQAGLRTTAVALGARHTAWIARGLIVAAAAYSLLVLRLPIGLGLLVALFVPLGSRNAERSWNGYRIIFGLGWLLLLASYRFGGGRGARLFFG